MKTVFAVLLGALLGYGIAWKIHGDDFLSAMDSAVQVASGENESLTGTIVSSDNDQSDEVISAILANQIDKSLLLAGYLDEASASMYLVRAALFDHLQALHDAEAWNVLNAWLKRLVDEGYRWHQLHLWYANLYAANEQMQESFEQLFLAKQFAADQASGEFVQARIESQIIKLDLSDPSNLSILKWVREKQPEHPLLALKEATYHQSRGDISQALVSLEFVSYHQEYTEQVDVLQHALQEQLNSLIYQENGIPLARYGSQFVIDVVLANRHKIPLLLDTGASISAISQEVVEQLRRANSVAALERTIQLSTANGTAQAQLYSVGSLSIGQFQVNDLTLVGVDLGGLRHAQGLLGMDFLSHFQFTIDQKSNLLYLESR